MKEFPAYNPEILETKWQKYWLDSGILNAKNDPSMPKFYPLVEFPYPSAEGLHVGHPRPYTAMDILARKRRMDGYDVLFPMGWDAFGLPTENFAIKNNIHPAIITERNINNFRRQLQRLGFSFDYSREISTTDPAYYKWTQWIFLQLFKHNLAYKAEMPVNWCSSCRVGLANEEVVAGVCERCGGEVVRRVKSQWMLRITEYAEKLLNGLNDVDFIETVKTQQRNWIGRSEGAEVIFRLDANDHELQVFTTRPDTLFGATYMVISPEHPVIKSLKDKITNYDQILEYQEISARKSDFERTEINKDKTGVPIEGVMAINPVTGNKIPVWVSDYVLMGYGTGAIMAVPGHDQRDWEFAKKFGLNIVEVVAGGNVAEAAFTDIEQGTMVNSGFLNGLSVTDAQKHITQWLEEKGLAHKKVNYKLRDWVFSRQRYWGESIPVGHCDCCGWVPIPEEQLPVVLPEVDNFMPGENGESPLANATDWVNTTCPKCGGPAQRETDTMPQWAGSSWYYLRYLDPHNDSALASPEAMERWMPVDWYNGGMEHTTLHLLYSRFWHKFLYDIGIVPTPEPYAKRTAHGMILGNNGEKMSKSRGNVINPDDVVAEIGADAFRVYEMFMGAFDQAIPWSTDGAHGCRRFLDRVWRLSDLLTDEEGITQDMQFEVHSCIKKVTEDYERMKFNTAIAAMMSLVNALTTKGRVSRGELRILLQLLNPAAPHITEELNQLHALGDELAYSPWPEFDPAALVKDQVEIAIQLNGKVRGRMMVPSSLAPEEAENYFTQSAQVQQLLNGKTVRKLIYIPGRLANIVVG